MDTEFSIRIWEVPRTTVEHRKPWSKGHCAPALPTRLPFAKLNSCISNPNHPQDSENPFFTVSIACPSQNKRRLVLLPQYPSSTTPSACKRPGISTSYVDIQSGVVVRLAMTTATPKTQSYSPRSNNGFSCHAPTCQESLAQKICSRVLRSASLESEYCCNARKTKAQKDDDYHRLRPPFLLPPTFFPICL